MLIEIGWKLAATIFVVGIGLFCYFMSKHGIFIEIARNEQVMKRLEFDVRLEAAKIAIDIAKRTSQPPQVPILGISPSTGTH